LLSAALVLAVPALGASASAKRRASAPCAGANLSPNRANAAAVERAIVCLIDRLRAQRHLRALHFNRYLRSVADAQVRLMVRWNYFSDIRPSGQTPAGLIARTHYAVHAPTLSTGQNIGWGTGSNQTPASMVAAWMNSPPHRQIILTGEFHDIGAGVAAAVPSLLDRGRLGATYAVEFAARGS
jgi:uncharacterized protein YkwD